MIFAYLLHHPINSSKRFHFQFYFYVNSTQIISIESLAYSAEPHVQFHFHVSCLVPTNFAVMQAVLATALIPSHYRSFIDRQSCRRKIWARRRHKQVTKRKKGKSSVLTATLQCALCSFLQLCYAMMTLNKANSSETSSSFSLRLATWSLSSHRLLQKQLNSSTSIFRRHRCIRSMHT